MRFSTIAITAVAMIASVDLAVTRCSAQEASGGVYEVLRTTDKDMTCQQLAGEANSLNATILAQNKPRNDGNGRKVGGAVAGGLLAGAGHFGLARFGGGIPGVGGMFARAAAEQATNAAASAVAGNGQDQAPAAPPTVTPEQQRMNHLLGLYKEKGC